MQRFSTHLGPHKADIALFVAGVGLVGTITLTIFGLADGYNPITSFWIASVTCTAVGLVLCWRWRPSRSAVIAAIADSWGIWGIVVTLAILVQDWREAILFMLPLLVALTARTWLKRQS
jgi:hypothetical protein